MVHDDRECGIKDIMFRGLIVRHNRSTSAGELTRGR
jgi:hypothetical protein